jgi:hypothetical protein
MSEFTGDSEAFSSRRFRAAGKCGSFGFQSVRFRLILLSYDDVLA